jgi:hypothetical protein
MLGMELQQSSNERFGRMIRDEVLKMSKVDGQGVFGYVTVHELLSLARGLGLSDNKVARGVQWLEDSGCAEVRDENFCILCHPLD